MAEIYNLNIPQTKPLTPPHIIREQYPLSYEGTRFISQTREQIQQILDGRDERLLLIVGPCSIHDIHAAHEYATKLHRLADVVSESFLVLMRVYFEKSRTQLGWKGIMMDPYIDGSHEIDEGIRRTRELLVDLSDRKIATASELLSPWSAPYFEDCLSWGCIGARTSESQIHRQLASGLSLPIGFKNNTDGNISVAVNGIVSSSHPQVYFGLDDRGTPSSIQTQGNQYSHLVLRGGESGPNYDPTSIESALKLLEEAELPKRLIIDCSHGNSGKQHEKQSPVVESAIKQLLDGNRSIRGLILESHLRAGKQSLEERGEKLRYGVSITDPCIDWTTTEQLVLWAHHKILEEKKQKTTEPQETDITCGSAL